MIFLALGMNLILTQKFLGFFMRSGEIDEQTIRGKIRIIEYAKKTNATEIAMSIELLNFDL